MSVQRLLLPAEYVAAMIRCGASSGIYDITVSQPENLIVVSGSSYDSPHNGRMRVAGNARMHDEHFAGRAETGNGIWYRVEPGMHETWRYALQRNGALSVDALRSAVSGWRQPGGPGMTTPVITIATAGDDLYGVSAWIVQGGQVAPAPIDVFDPDVDRLAPLEGHWPTNDLAREKIVLVGAGSIGSAVCDALLAYGARTLTMIDPDHLSPHNFARHTASTFHVGRYKVNALAHRLRERDPTVTVHPLSLDVIDHADVVRGELQDASAMIACLDGVEPRRVANHLAVRAGVPLILACVLDNGRVGEVLRVLPCRFECLTCNRVRLQEKGAIALEAALDRGYGTGTRKLPMTAVFGDLMAVGALAAKAAVATILERAGHRDQVLAGEHATIGLRPSPELPAPFDRPLGEVRWLPGKPPRADCVTCARR